MCKGRTDPAPLPMGFGVQVGGPEAPGDRSLEGTKEGIRAGYPTVRKPLMAGDGRAEGRRKAGGRSAGGFRDTGVRISWPRMTLCDPGIPGPGRRGDPQIHILARRRGREMIWVSI
jgi:hypothetical protein